MTTFYPGPSKIYPQIEQYMHDAFKIGILQMNHRSQVFMDMMQKCIMVFKEKQKIPADYQVYFTSSATECWEIIAQSLCKKGSFHFYNGAFGEKWFEQNVARSDASWHKKITFKINETIDYQQVRNYENIDLLCFTQNETSNGTQINDLPTSDLPNLLIAQDVTSSLGGVALDWQKADIWLASVQKCLGLPAGMGVMIVSPKALKHAQNINDKKYYNSLLFIHQNFEKFQTHYTPNVLNIYLLMRVMEQVPDIVAISNKIKSRAIDFYEFIEQKTNWKLLVKNPDVRSDTVIAIEGNEKQINEIKMKALEKNIILGNGYGEWKNSTFRIANFPSIEDSEFEQLKNILI